MAIAGTILFAPTDMEIGVTVQICTAGMPTESISFTIAAPQRVHVPQADVRIAPSTFASKSSLAISKPNFKAFFVAIPFPEVT